MPSKLDAFADKLAQWLSDAARTSHKQRCSLKQMHADLWLMSVSTVVFAPNHQYAHEWTRKHLCEDNCIG